MDPDDYKRWRKEHGICPRCGRPYDGVKWCCAACSEVKNAKQRVRDRARKGKA